MTKAEMIKNQEAFDRIFPAHTIVKLPSAKEMKKKENIERRIFFKTAFQRVAATVEADRPKSGK